MAGSVWLTASDVAAYMSGDVSADDPNLILATDGVAAYLEQRRSDVFGTPDEPIVGDPVVSSALHLGAIMWAVHVFEVRTSPSGYQGYGDGAGDAMFDLSTATNRGDIWRLTGVKGPVVF